MKMMLWIACWAMSSLGFTGLSHAQDAANYPTRPIRLIVGFTAGGGNDIIARAFGQKLSESLGQPVIIDNRPGAGGMVAAEFVARSAADGYSILIGASGAMTISPALSEKISFDTLRDFAPVSELGSFPLVLIVNTSSPFKTVADLVEFSKQNPDKANYSSASASFQLATELFKQKTGARMQMIPYKGTNEAVTAVLAGDVLATIADAGPVSVQVKGGQARALAVSSPDRLADLPDVPTMKQAGADVEAVLWTGAFVPKATPPDIVKRLQDEFVRIAKLPEVIARLKVLNIDAVGNSSDEFARIIDADLQRWASVVRAGNIKVAQ